MTGYIKPYSDVFIQYLLGSEHNSDLLLSFINAVLWDSNFYQITRAKVKNPFNIKTFKLDKASILDVKAEDEKGRKYNIEIQASWQSEYVLRSLYYLAKLYSQELKQGDTYQALKPAICMNVVNFTIFKDLPKRHSCFILREKINPEYVLTDHLQLHFLELSKLEDKLEEYKKHKHSKLNWWLLFMKFAGLKEELMKYLISEDEDIAKAYKEYEYFSQDEELREIYESRMKWERDQTSRIQAAKAEGRKEGREEGHKEGHKEGREEGMEKVALNMLKSGLPIEQIANLTELTQEEVQALSQKIAN